jgi:hypothetical protein
VIGLDPGADPACFSAEAYAVDLGLRGAPDDCRINYGEQMAKGLFWSWARRSGQASEDSQPLTSGPEAIAYGSVCLSACLSSVGPSVCLALAPCEDRRRQDIECCGWWMGLGVGYPAEAVDGMASWEPKLGTPAWVSGERQRRVEALRRGWLSRRFDPGVQTQRRRRPWACAGLATACAKPGLLCDSFFVGFGAGHRCL